MALSNLLKIAAHDKKSVAEIDPKKIEDNLDKYQRIIAYWRMYPDKFVDYMASLNPNNKFQFYPTQRIILRINMRYRTVYEVFSRGFSKSFMAVLSLMVKAILYPGSTLITVADAKGQSAMILQSKMQEICKLIPGLAREIVWDTRGTLAKTSQSKDEVTYSFRNGSTIKNVSMTSGSRGFRAQAVLTEEVATITDQQKYEEIIAPMLVISRKVNGKVDPDETLNQNDIYVTSAGFKGTYAYDKLIDALCRMVSSNGYDSFILGGDWRVPVVEGLQPANYIQAQETGNSMDEIGFEREYGSVWSGTLDGAFFDMNKFDKHRIINLAKNGYDKGQNRDTFYVMGVDVGRLNCPTEIVIIESSPARTTGVNDKKIVNIFTLSESHFEYQAIRIKQLFNAFKCEAIVLDANGLGVGLLDYLITDQNDPETDELLPNMGIINLDDIPNEQDRKNYKSFENENTIKNAIWMMKANAPMNTELYSYTQAQLRNGKLKFLIDSNTAKNKLLQQAQGKKMSPLQRQDYLRPYVATDILKSQMANLVQDNEGANIILKQSNRKILKDKVSALIYGLYWCKRQEDRRNRRNSRDLSGFMFFTKH